MLSLVNILIVFFICLIVYQIFLASKNKLNIIEGLANNYQSYEDKEVNKALILSQKNAGNIEFLKDQIGDLQHLNQIVTDLSGNVQTLQTQVNGLVQAQQQYASQMTGGTTPQITGVTDDDTNDNTDANDTTDNS